MSLVPNKSKKLKTTVKSKKENENHYTDDIKRNNLHQTMTPKDKIINIDENNVNIHSTQPSYLSLDKSLILNENSEQKVNFNKSNRLKVRKLGNDNIKFEIMKEIQDKKCINQEPQKSKSYLDIAISSGYGEVNNEKTLNSRNTEEFCSKTSEVKMQQRKRNNNDNLKILPEKKIKLENLENYEQINVCSTEADGIIIKNEIKTEDENLYEEQKAVKNINNNNRDLNENTSINMKENAKCKTEEPINIFQKPKKNLFDQETDWEINMLVEKGHTDYKTAEIIINMFKNDYTVPFIARYRRDKTNNMDASQLRHIKEIHNNIKILKDKAYCALKKIEKLGKLTPVIKNRISCVQSVEELDFIIAPFKQGIRKTRAENARSLGLENIANIILSGSRKVQVSDCIKYLKKGLKDYDSVIVGIQDIIADIFSKNEDVISYLHDLKKEIPVTITSKKIKTTNNENKKKSVKQEKNNDLEQKYQLYYDFKTTTKSIRPYQILALNRGENQKILTVKICPSDKIESMLYKFCENKWLHYGCTYELRTKIFENSFFDSMTRLIWPFVQRSIRAELNSKANQAAIESFTVNLKNLLQTPPIKGCSILGIDPGITHGCKFALICHRGTVLWTSILYFHDSVANSKINEENMKIMKEKLLFHKCKTIAIGNGTGCRKIEQIISHYIKNNYFKPLNIKYTIVNERGASIYSCNDIAKEEFPNLDLNIISAVFIARSLQDPLNEFVKVEPQHLGVGMYQHDVPEKQLINALDEVVSECVSFIGVDVNTASVHLLRRIAGLTSRRASNIIKWREKHGPFTNREQLKLVEQIGPKTFEQCSGFIRVHPQTAVKQMHDLSGVSCENENLDIENSINPLDRTWIHPESYNIAHQFMNECQVKLKDLGTSNFINKIRSYIQSHGLSELSLKLQKSETLINFIAEALTKPDDFDYRSQFSKPVFKEGLTDINKLKRMMILNGVIANVTDFGAFVDIGLDRNGLIPLKNFNKFTVQIGDRVLVRIENIEVKRGRISLFLINLL